MLQFFNPNQLTMHTFIQIQTTSDQRETLETIAKQLIENKLAACVQISSPISSFFRWKDKVDSAVEFVAAIKTRAQLFDAVAAVIGQHHNYELPQIIAVPIVHVSDDFADWIRSETE
jgi:periplasmic divalent cation tolerance protein